MSGAVSKKEARRQGPLARVNADAAGIDLGARAHHVAVPPERGAPVKMFGCYSADLDEMAAWLHSHGVKTVAMESTGVYWVPVFQKLEKHGFDVQLVSTRHMKVVPGRKTDVLDCQWIQYLHECGLLRGSFRPQDAICVVRAYVRQRDTLTEEGARHIQRIQKVLEQMNLQLHKVVSDVTGETGMAIIDAVLKGERDGQKLAELRNYRCKKSKEEIARALVGDFRDELLFCLRQEVGLYRVIQEQIELCEKEILARLQALETKVEASELEKPRSRKDDVEVRQSLLKVAGVDLSLVPGLGTTNLVTLFAEVGFDLRKFPSEKAFASWATLAPKNFITGGKRYRTQQAASSRVANAFRVAAQTLANSQSSLGAFYRRMRGRKGGAFAVATTAHKLAKLFYRLLTCGEQYVERGADYYQQRYRNQQVNAALKTLRNHGFQAALTTVP